MKEKVNAIFISDVHLCHPSSKTKELTEFLKKYETDNIYLIGDVIDFWHLRRHKLKFYKDQTAFIKYLFSLARERKSKITYLIGNHDYNLKFLLGFDDSKSYFKIVRELDYTTIDGRRFLLCHGDQFDTLTFSSSGRFIMYFGDFLYDLVSYLDRLQLYVRRKRKMKYWSLAGYCKKAIKTAAIFIQNFEQIIALHAKSNDYNGVICGHIHNPAIKEIICNCSKESITYINTGDWVESCSAVVETMDGQFELKYNEPDYEK